jgi:hypothetical protein
MRITIHIRLILYLLGIYAFIYLIVGIQQSNFYGRISSGRAQMASVDRGDIHVGILYSTSEDNSSFLNGVNLAIAEVNSRRNERGGEGILYHLSDGKTAITRKIRPIYLPVKDSKSLTIASHLVTDIEWKKHLVAIVSGLSASMTLRTRLIPEYFGIAGISVRPTLPALTQEDFQYFVRTIPNYRELSRYFMSNIPLTIAKKSGKRIRKIGIFFSTASPEGYLQALIAERENVNERIRVIECLRAGFESGILNELNDLDDLKGSKFLQASLNLDSILIDRFIKDNVSAEDIAKPVTLKALVERYDPQETATELVFTKSFIPGQKDYRPLIMLAEKNNPDLIVMASGIPESLNLIRQIREMGWNEPIMVSRINDFEQLLQIPTDRLNDVYGASMYDPGSQEPRFTAFRDKYEKYLKATNKKVIASNFLSIQGYEAIHLLAQVIAKSDSTVPINICNSLKYATTPLEGQVFERYSFSPEGDILNRKLYTLFFDNGTMTTIKE